MYSIFRIPMQLKNFEISPLEFIHRHFCAPLILRIFTNFIGLCPDDPLEIYFPYVDHLIILGGLKIPNSNSNCSKRPLVFCLRLLVNFKMGLAESFMYGYWDAEPSAKDFISLLIRAKRKKCSNSFQQKNSMKPLNLLQFLLSKLTSMWNYFWYKMRPNSLDGSRKNISEHYDEGNEMFRLFLDPSMTYSCAIFNDSELASFEQDGTVPTMEQLYEAQLSKFSRAIGVLGLRGSERVLEIGCGWDSCAIYAAKYKANLHWTALTISLEQFKLANERVQIAGLEGRICIKFMDYRQVTGLYDHIVTIEMVEAVGHEYLPTFFETCAKLLKPGGRIFLQAIVCPDREYERYRRSSDFIKKHIFPGGKFAECCRDP